jgi:hypothetical protein
MRKIVQKKCSFNNEIKCQERPRMQDFAPFIPELLGATEGPQTVEGSAQRTAVPSASICLLLQNLLTSLILANNFNVISQ